jgi:hypothetical protein
VFIDSFSTGDFSESNSSNNVITHVVFTDDLVSEENQVMEESSETEVSLALNKEIFCRPALKQIFPCLTRE